MPDEDRQGRSRVRASGIAAHVRAAQIAFACEVEELWEDGAFLRTDHRLAVGVDLDINFVKPGGRKALRIKGRVSRAVASGNAHHHPGLDVTFTRVDDADSERLVAWLGEMTQRAAVRERAPIQLPDEPAPPAPVPAPAAPAVENALAGASSQQEARLIIQIKGLLLEQDDLRGQLCSRDAEIAELRRALAAAEKLIGRRPQAD